MLSIEAAVDTMVSYFSRVDDHTQIRDAIKDRYATGIVKVTDPATGVEFVTYTKGAKAAQVDAGIIEAINIGFANKVVDALATLTTEPTQKFTLTHDTVEDVTNAEELLNAHRAAGGFSKALSRADRKSVQVGSALVFLQFAGGTVTYKAMAPSSMRAYFSSTVVEDGVPRAVDKTDLEDAFCITLRLSEVDNGRYNYLAIFARSENYPNGRYVFYESAANSTEIPDQGSDGVIDFELDGGPANPLTWLGNQDANLNLPEYPIAVIYGGTTDDQDVVCPITDSLYRDSLEFDVAASHLLSGSQDDVAGTDVITRSEVGACAPLPLSTRGTVVLQPGLTFGREMGDASAKDAAEQIHVAKMIQAASGYGVPDYMVVSQDHTLDASSGVALQIKARPLVKNRERRVDDNEASIRRVFKIEQGLIRLFDQSANEAEIKLLSECSQLWDPGELKLPENRKEKAETLSLMLKDGVIDIIYYIREINQLPSDDDAIALYDSMKERGTEYTPLVSMQPQQPRTVGLRRTNAGITDNGAR
jgi:hypothetical protein